MKRTSGFTLIEIIISVVAIGILSAMVYPSFRGLITPAKDNAAIVKAEALNSAMFTYMRRIPNASSNWAGAADDAARYDLLFGQGYLPLAASALSGYQPSGYSYAFPAILTSNGRVAITGPNGTVSY